MKLMYSIMAPADSSGIGVIGVWGDIENIISGMSSNNPRFKNRERGLYYVILSFSKDDLQDEVLIMLESNRLMITFHGGIAIEKNIIAFLEEKGSIQWNSHWWWSDIMRKEDFNALQRCVNKRGLTHFSQYTVSWWKNIFDDIMQKGRSGDIDEALDVLDGLVDGWEIRNGFINPPRVFLIGYENAGKSTLFNALIGYERVVVTDIPGTTMDAVDETILIHDYPCTIIDTPGLKQGETLRNCNWLHFIEPRDYCVIVRDVSSTDNENAFRELKEQIIVIIDNKIDTCPDMQYEEKEGYIKIAALFENGIDKVRDCLYTHIVPVDALSYSLGCYTEKQIQAIQTIRRYVSMRDMDAALKYINMYFFMEERDASYC